jgi:hypothetical protein
MSSRFSERTRRPRSQQSDRMNSSEMSALRALCGQDVRAPRRLS